jgi:AcrR family transcriptional regulator
MKKRISKADWLEAALEVLRDEGFEAIRVERLARRIGISKSGFYWHFQDRQDLLKQLLDYWSREYTDVVRGNPEVQKLPPADRLQRIMEMVLSHDLNELDLSIRAWALHDPSVARKYHQVVRGRLEFVSQAFRDLGFEGEELELRTRLLHGYVTWERFMYPPPTKRERRDQIPLLHSFLTRK